MPSFSSRPAPTPPRLLFKTLAGLLLLLAWDASGLDLPMARWFGSASGFALENHWLWRYVLHDDIHLWPWVLELGLMAGIFLPVGSLRQLPMARRAQLALTTLAALLAISAIKLHSHTSCPWDLQAFGGAATYVSHWAWGLRDGGSGGCFPAGHASAGFSFIGGFFAFRHALPQTARRWLMGAMAAGLLLGLAQQVRGAHYMSHTLWTAWLCWVVAGGLDALVSRLIARTPPPAPALAPALSALAPSTPAN
ncbi:MAG: (acid phosphatase) superfamily protein-like protein [Polaromonas sp.]|nr:(acid phosphatase) superfamily protein-like protein [Polaromonas sp.]